MTDTNRHTKRGQSVWLRVLIVIGTAAVGAVAFGNDLLSLADRLGIPLPRMSAQTLAEQTTSNRDAAAHAVATDGVSDTVWRLTLNDGGRASNWRVKFGSDGLISWAEVGSNIFLVRPGSVWTLDQNNVRFDSVLDQRTFVGTLTGRSISGTYTDGVNNAPFEMARE